MKVWKIDGKLVIAENIDRALEAWRMDRWARDYDGGDFPSS